MTAHDVFVPWRPPCSVCADVSHSVEGSNSLHIAAEKGHFDVAKTLIEYTTKPLSRPAADVDRVFCQDVYRAQDVHLGPGLSPTEHIEQRLRKNNFDDEKETGIWLGRYEANVRAGLVR